MVIKRPMLPEVAPGESPKTCRRCTLWEYATQSVEGEGAAQARVMLVGEQPGDEEDLHGRPFVGPAGRVLNEALVAAAMARKDVFITNAVKHFKWEPRGKQRLHKKPGLTEIYACEVWLEREIAAVKPNVIVALGTTALRALTGANLSIKEARTRKLCHLSGALILGTYHPSAILRAPQGGEELRAQLIDDLRLAARMITAASE